MTDPHAASNQQARLNARIALAEDPVLRWDRQQELRAVATVYLAPSYVIAEALLAGVPVPARRLEPTLVSALKLEGDVTLDPELALRIVAHGPLRNVA